MKFESQLLKGVAPVAWGDHLPQLELAEALHCALLGLDQLDAGAAGPVPDGVPEP